MDTSFGEWELQRFASTLRAPEDYSQLGLKQCRKVIDRISTELIGGEEEDTLFEVHSSHIGGTLARETDVLIPEFDLIIYVAVAESKREELFNLPYFFGVAVQILKENRQDLNIIPGSIGVFENSTIRFMFEQGITVNLWPFPYEEQNSKVGHLSEHLKTVQALEAREQFMRDQSSFAHDVVRLAKFWVQSKGPYYLGEADTTKILRMMELIGVAASMDTEGKYRQLQTSFLMQMNDRNRNGGSLEHPPNMVQAFGKVFELLGDLGNLKLMFQKVEDEKWNPKPSTSIKRGVTLKKVRSGKWERYPERSLQMMPTFSTLKCFIMDPANFNYNVLQDFKEPGINRLMIFGKKSLACLAKYRNNIYTIRYNGRTVMQFDEFFEPALPNRNLFFPKEYSVDYVDSYPAMFVCVDVENQGLFTANPKIRSFTNMMKDNLQFMVKSVLEQGLNWGEIRSTLERTVRRYGKLYIPPEMTLIEEELSEKDHPSFDVNIYVPFGSDVEKGGAPRSFRALRFGMSWKM